MTNLYLFSQDPLDQWGRQARVALQVPRVPMEHLVRQGRLDQLGHVGNPVHVVKLVKQDHLEVPDQRVREAQLVPAGRTAHRVKLDLADLLVNPDSEANQEHQANRVTQHFTPLT